MRSIKGSTGKVCRFGLSPDSLAGLVPTASEWREEEPQSEAVGLHVIPVMEPEMGLQAGEGVAQSGTEQWGRGRATVVGRGRGETRWALGLGNMAKREVLSPARWPSSRGGCLREVCRQRGWSREEQEEGSSLLEALCNQRKGQGMWCMSFRESLVSSVTFLVKQE